MSRDTTPEQLVSPALAETREIVLELMRYSRQRGYTVQLYFADGVHRSDEDALDCFEIIKVNGDCICKVLIGDDGALTRGYPCSVCGWENACGEPPGEDCHS